MELPINQILHGDCLEILKTFPDKCVDLVLTDPPYGVKLGSRSKEKYDITDDTAEKVIPMVNAILTECFRVANVVVMTPGVKNMFAYPKPDHVGSFFYPSATGMNKWGFSCWQPIFFYGKDPYAGKGSLPDSKQSTESAEKNGHPCPKPIKQWMWLLNRCSLKGQTVLDPFLGSGTTAVAAKMENRKYIGIEISEKYCEIARQRVASAPTPLFVN